MSEFIAPLSLSVAAVLIAAMLCAAGLSAWRGWLGYKRLQLATERQSGGMADDAEAVAEADMGVRIELAAVKERLRQLEAIANGVEL